PPSATTLESLVTHWSHDFTTRFTPRWVPLEAQTEHQVRTTLAAAIHTPHP
ncbi:3-hydroxyacyl-CoA dehydrogenase, partial [Streptomyces albidoflavus]